MFVVLGQLSDAVIGFIFAKSCDDVAEATARFTPRYFSTIYFIFIFIQFINQQWHRSTRNGIEVQAKNILAEWPTQG